MQCPGMLEVMLADTARAGSSFHLSSPEQLGAAEQIVEMNNSPGCEGESRVLLQVSEHAKPEQSLGEAASSSGCLAPGLL